MVEVTWQILEGDCREVLRSLPAQSAQTCVTSPPYFGLRDYGNDEQIGLEPTPDEFVAVLVEVFREVRRVLRDDGTVWLNLGDSYAQAKGHGHWESRNGKGDENAQKVRQRWRNVDASDFGVKPKDLLGIPWMVAFALRADGWYLRSDIIWSKPNPMPESVTDRPTKAHEYLFLLSKGSRYFYDADAIREQGQDWSRGGPGVGIEPTHHYGVGNGGNAGLADLAGRYKTGEQAAGRNRRSVWTVATQSYSGAHFATFPPKLIEPCILAGSAKGDVVLDPFAGSGTTGVVAGQLQRDFVGVELNPEYAAMARERILVEGRPGQRTHEPTKVHDDQLGMAL